MIYGVAYHICVMLFMIASIVYFLQTADFVVIFSRLPFFLLAFEMLKK